MVQNNVAQIFLAKAQEALAGVESEYSNARYNNCANLLEAGYYACFQAAISALIQAGVQPRGTQWGHEFVQAEFAGQLINRRRLYPSNLRDVLSRLLLLRQQADYESAHVTQTRALRAVRRARALVEAVQRGAEIR